MDGCCVVARGVDVSVSIPRSLPCSGVKRKLEPANVASNNMNMNMNIKKIRTTTGYEMSREDFSQALQKVFDKSRRELATMVGAVEYAQKQFEKQRHSATCVCCDRKLLNHAENLSDYEKRINKAVTMLKKSELSTKLIRCVELNQKLSLQLSTDVSPTPAELKIGEKLAIRRQKQRALTEKRCTICSHDLSTTQLGVFLSKADRSLR